MDDLSDSVPARLSFELSSEEDGSALVRLRGDLDMTGADELDVAARPIIAASPDRLVVDVSDLRFADSSAIALWVRWANAVRRLEIRGPSPLLRRVIERMGLAETLGLTA
jgi:anti-anti-sigma factor